MRMTRRYYKLISPRHRSPFCYSLSVVAMLSLCCLLFASLSWHRSHCMRTHRHSRVAAIQIAMPCRLCQSLQHLGLLHSPAVLFRCSPAVAMSGQTPRRPHGQHVQPQPQTREQSGVHRGQYGQVHGSATLQSTTLGAQTAADSFRELMAALRRGLAQESRHDWH